MKRFSLLRLMIALSVALIGCGGGGGGDTAGTSTPETPTPIGTTVNLTSFKNVFYGKTDGAQYAFTLNGSDTKGNPWTGMYAVVADGPKYKAGDANPAPLTRARTLVTLQQGGNAPSSIISTIYFMASDESVYWYVDGKNEEFLPNVTCQPLPNSAKVGDFETLANLKSNLSYGINKIYTIWQLKPDVNGASQLVITSDIHKYPPGHDTEIDTFTIDANGDPTKVSIRVITRDSLDRVALDLTLSGNRN